MQQAPRWKPAANLDLLLGTGHPPARISRDPETSLANADGAGVCARDTVSFKDTLYCNRQDSGYAGTRQRLAEYYRLMFSKIPLWEESALGSETKVEGVESTVIKSEVVDEAISIPGNNTEMSSFRALGILTQTSSPSAIGEELLLPWEFFPIMDIADDEAYIEPIKALTKEAAPANGLLHVEAENEGDETTAGDSSAVAAAAAGVVAPDTAFNSHNVQRLSLYTRLVKQFTGVYPGMAVGIVGEPFRRSSSGALTAILVRNFVLPVYPEFPWSVERPLSSLPLLPSPIPTRVHFCSGPFPRRDIPPILSAVTLNALLRGADLLIIGGPLVKEFEEFEKDLMATVQTTFDELLGTYMDTIEETMENYYAVNSNPRVRHRLKVVLVAHKDDVTQIPVIPTTMYGLQDGQDVWVRSNPCRIAVNGIHFGVCNENVVGDMRDRMVERWPTQTGSLRRVVEALVQSRLYAPIYELPAVKHDIKHLNALRMDYVPEAGATLEDSSQPAVLTWDSLSSFVPAKEEQIDDVKQETKRIKRDDGEPSHLLQSTTTDESSAEWFPHVMFLPSTRPRFVVVTHRSVRDAATSTRRDEWELDDTTAASGVMVINQEVWNRRSSQKFELRVAEVTIPNSEQVMRHGASEANGVACGVIHFSSGVATS
ncbi:DNA polymerase alpha subunit B [Trypanosoma grayi]|uniref:DNA polymerase alpha subunit B n=1 Tax=Trypanosoma grayi TaxID=71804 RepID=UPI0004F3FA93|nr:DNA polymerase alpha subunit B [Trypanosoma grayi]KEG15397.1 DNA polymerase alpha subunit B [Trypanosoma grayi]